MGEERRYTDLRMDNMEKDIEEIKEFQKVTQKAVSETREKVFNGFDKAIREAHENTIEIRKAIKILDKAVSEMHTIVFQTPEQRLADCPFKKEMIGSYEKKLRVYLTLGAIFVAAAAGLPGWIKLIGG